MAEHVVQRPVVWGFAWPASIAAAIVAFLLTVAMPPVGFLAGLIAIGVLGIGFTCRKTNLAVAIAAGVTAAVLCYLGIWLVGSIVDPGAPSNGSGSSAPQIP